MTITERLDKLSLTVEDVAAEVTELDRYYKLKRKRLTALLRVLESEQGEPEEDGDEHDDDVDRVIG